jgi:integrase
MARPQKLPPGMTKRGTTYYACFRHDGRLVRKRLSSDFAAAKTILNDLRARADRQDFGIVDNAYPWDDLKAEFLRWAKQAIRRPDDFNRDLGRFEKFQRVATCRQIDQSYIVAFRAWRLAQDKGAIAGKDWKVSKGVKVSPRTVNREVGTLASMLNKGVEWGRLGSNPLAGLKSLEHSEARKQRRSLSSEEVQSILATAPAYLKPAFRLFAVAAIRRTELVELLFSDVDFERRSISIRATIAKNGRAREINIDDDTLAMLAKLRDEAPHREAVEGHERDFSRDHVFVTSNNTPHRHNILRAFYRVCKRAGIEGGHQGGSVDIHSLRVTSASLMLENGASPKAVQSILGHSTLAMTMNVYAKATEKAKRDAVSSLPFVTKVSPPAGVVSLPNVPKARASNLSALKAVAAQ